MEAIKVLAVDDPAVQGYVKPEYDILGRYGKPVVFDILPWELYYPKMMEALTGQADYDIVMAAGHLWLQELVEKNYLAPLPEIEEDILQGLRKDLVYEGRTYLSPAFFDGHIVVYRKNEFATDWPEVISPSEYIDRIAAKGVKQSIAMKASPAEIFTDALPFLRMFGKDVYEEETKRIQCADLDIVNGLKAYLKLREFAVLNTNSFGNAEVANSLKNGTAIAGVTWSGQMGVVYQPDCIARDELGFATFNTAWNAVWSFGVNAQSKRCEECFALLKYLRSYEVDRLVSEVSGTPLHARIYQERDYPWYSCQLKMVELAKPLPFIANAGIKNQVLYREITKSFNAEKSPEQGLYEAEKIIANL